MCTRSLAPGIHQMEIHAFSHTPANLHHDSHPRISRDVYLVGACNGLYHRIPAAKRRQIGAILVSEPRHTSSKPCNTTHLLNCQDQALGCADSWILDGRGLGRATSATQVKSKTCKVFVRHRLRQPKSITSILRSFCDARASWAASRRVSKFQFTGLPARSQVRYTRQSPYDVRMEGCMHMYRSYRSSSFSRNCKYRLQ